MIPANSAITDNDTFEERECKRKVGYPLQSMAEKARVALEESENEKFQVYLCNECGQFHVAHLLPTSVRKVDEEERPIVHKFFVEYAGVCYATIRDATNFYVFMIPCNTEENENSILSNGFLIATKKGHDYYRGKFGTKSSFQQFKLFSSILPIPVKEWARFREKIEKIEENIETLEDAKNFILNGIPPKHLEAKQGRTVLVRPKDDEKRLEELELLEKQEMYRGKAVFRTPEGRPYFRNNVKCVGCGTEIKLRAYICTDSKGKLTSPYPYAPEDQTSMRTYASKGKMSEWTCGTCLGKKLGASPATEAVKQEKEDLTLGQVVKAAVEAKATVSFSIENLDTQLLTDLENIASDPDFDDAFVRGATLMLCHLLK